MKGDFFASKILEWRSNNHFYFPWRDTENLWHALVAEILLQRTKAEQVVKVFNEFCIKYPTPSDYTQEKNCKTFDSLGLKWRARELHKLAEILSGKEIPSEKEELIRLPGVGDYIASAFRSLHLRKYDVIIDSNVVRLFGRYYGIQTDGETRRKKWFKKIVESMTPENDFRDYNYGLIDFTRTVCKPKPLCTDCLMTIHCESRNDYI